MPTDPRVDAYIAKANDFAKPILKEIRAAVHSGHPRIASGKPRNWKYERRG